MPVTREYNRPVPATWWLKKPAYVKYVIRELTAVFAGGYAIFLLVLLQRAKDPGGFHTFVPKLKSPVSLALHAMVLLFVFIHSVTFFNLTPRVLAFHRGEERVRDGTIQGAHYLLWLVVSLVLFGIALWI